LIRSRTAANEASAVGTLRTVDTAEVTYSVAYPKRGYAPDLATMGPQPGGGAASDEHAALIDNTIGNASCTAGEWCTKSGYRFRLKATCLAEQCTQYVVTATPISPDTGTRNFCSTEDGVIRFQAGGPMTEPLTRKACLAWPPVQ